MTCHSIITTTLPCNHQKQYSNHTVNTKPNYISKHHPEQKQHYRQHGCCHVLRTSHSRIFEASPSRLQFANIVILDPKLLPCRRPGYHGNHQRCRRYHHGDYQRCSHHPRYDCWVPYMQHLRRQTSPSRSDIRKRWLGSQTSRTYDDDENLRNLVSSLSWTSFGILPVFFYLFIFSYMYQYAGGRRKIPPYLTT